MLFVDVGQIFELDWPPVVQSSLARQGEERRGGACPSGDLTTNLCSATAQISLSATQHHTQSGRCLLPPSAIFFYQQWKYFHNLNMIWFQQVRKFQPCKLKGQLVWILLIISEGVSHSQWSRSWLRRITWVWNFDLPLSSPPIIHPFRLTTLRCLPTPLLSS